MRDNLRFGGLAAMAAGLLITSCAQATAPESTQVVEAETSKPRVTLAPPITTVKPGASVVFSEQDPVVMTRGNTGVINITLNEGYPSGTLTLIATGEAGLSVLGGQAETEFDMAGRTTHTWRVDVAAEADGVHYLNLLAIADPKGGEPQHRAHAMRVEVGNWKSVEAERQASKLFEATPSGEMVVILEAEETIR